MESLSLVAIPNAVSGAPSISDHDLVFPQACTSMRCILLYKTLFILSVKIRNVSKLSNVDILVVCTSSWSQAGTIVWNWMRGFVGRFKSCIKHEAFPVVVIWKCQNIFQNTNMRLFIYYLNNLNVFHEYDR